MASSKRERELARMRAERQGARRAAAEARRRKKRATLLGVISAVAVVAVVVGVFVTVGGGSKQKDTLAASTKFGNLGGTGTCSYTASGKAAKTVDRVPPTKKVMTTGTQHAALQTSRGTVEAGLLTSKAPCTVNSFVFLAQQKYFDGTSCHRLVTKDIFVVQCGDPTATGSGGPGYQFADENLKGAVYPAGTMAMANGGPGTNGSQFFLVYKDTHLPASYTPFGKITKGLDILAAVAKGGSNPAGDGKPKLPISLTKVTVV